MLWKRARRAPLELTRLKQLLHRCIDAGAVSTRLHCGVEFKMPLAQQVTASHMLHWKFNPPASLSYGFQSSIRALRLLTVFREETSNLLTEERLPTVTEERLSELKGETFKG